MKRTLIASLFALAAIGAATSAQAGVNVAISLGEPGFYGQIDLGNAPAPALIYPQPVVVGAVVGGPALYLHVPAGYEHDWRHHCRQYNACGRQVYFVRDDWYQQTYVPHYHDHHYDGGWHDQRRVAPPPPRGRANDRHDDHRDDRRDDHRDDKHDRDHDH